MSLRRRNIHECQVNFYKQYIPKSPVVNITLPNGYTMYISIIKKKSNAMSHDFKMSKKKKKKKHGSVQSGSVLTQICL